VLSSATASGWWCRRSSTTSRGISNVGGDAPAAPLDGVDGGGLCRNRGCPRGRRARRLSRFRRRRRRPRWRWWPCSSPSRPWCRSGIAGTPSCRRRTASRRGVRRGSSSSAASFSAAKLSRVHETSASASATSATRNTGARVIPDLRTRRRSAAGAVDDRATAVDRRREERALGGREGGGIFAGDGAAVDADGAGDAHRHLDRADHVLDGGLGGLRGEAVVPDRVERRAGLRFDEQSARLGGGVGVGVRFEFVEAEVALPKRGLRGTRRLSCPTFPAPALKRSACSFLRYPLILWITVLPPLSELIPLAAAERPSAARVSERGSGRAPNTQTASPRVGRFINAAGTTGFPTGKRAVSATQLM